MAGSITQLKIQVPPQTPMVALLGERDGFLKLVESAFESDVLARGDEITIEGPTDDAEKVAQCFEELIVLLDRGQELTAASVAQTVELIKGEELKPSEVLGDVVLTRRGRADRRSRGSG